MKQPTDYMCAPTALFYLLEKQGYTQREITASDIRYMAKNLKTDPINGTSGLQILKYLTHQSIPFKLSSHIYPDMLIAHSPNGEPHYEVIVSHIDETQSVEVWDPETDTITTRTVESIEYSWHTPLSGERFGIHIPKKVA